MKNGNCRFEDYLSTWLIEEKWFAQAVSLYNRCSLPRMDAEIPERREDDEILRGPSGIGIIQLRGHLMKGWSSFGGTSTVEARRLIRRAVRDETLEGLMLYVDSPGGTAAGTFELAREVEMAAEQKPVRAHIEDLGASAAYWVASQAERITANAMAQVGSIGTVAMLIDSSKAMENAGLKVHVISTGEFKGAGAPGAPVTERQLAVFQEEIDDTNAHFLSGVRKGRGLSGARLAAVSTGRTWISDKAVQLGLMDAVMSWEEAVQDFAESLRQGDQRTRIALAEAELQT